MGALTAAAAGILIVTQSALAAVTWASPEIVGATRTWNDGMSLARTSTSTATYLHSIYTTDTPGGVEATDSGPYVGAYYSRGNASGTSWGTPKRLNSSSTHATASSIVASGKNIYAAFVLIKHWDGYDPAEPRQIDVRINSNYGASTSWDSNRLDPIGTRVDRPAMAGLGTGGVLLTYTDADTGQIKLYICGDLTTDASGCAVATVGTTTRMATNPADGYEGLPVVAAFGSTYAVAWLSAASGVTVRTRTNDVWASPTVITTSAAKGLSAAAKGTRFAFSWATSKSVRVKLWNNGVWTSTDTIASVDTSTTYDAMYSTAVALASTSTVGVAWAACRRADCTGSSTTGVDVRWRQSNDNGGTWAGSVAVAYYSVASTRRINDYPSVVMSSSTRRLVMYNTTSAGGAYYRVWLRVGTG